MSTHHLQPTDRPILYSVSDGASILAYGEIRVGDATGICELFDVVSETDENAYLAALDATLFPPLPAAGRLEQGDIYEYDGGAVMVRQSHNRTIYAPADTPALFVVYREDATGLDWVAGESVSVGTRRMYGGMEYECLQAHVAQADWTPPATPALWRVVAPPTTEWAAWTLYTIGDIVAYQGVQYQCRQSHTSQPGWEPPNVLALWLPL